mmetsp:Transcript_32892/g.48991  ORF Transcript_32892/g.48991 Transcript_32892/m.48991 type:complete len:134 (-) Transcript_32892:303-704(-)
MRASVLAFLATPASRHSHATISNRALQRSYSASTALSAKNYLLRYEYIPDVLEKRGPYREGHLGLAKQFIAEGTCLSGGPTGEVGEEVPTGALFVFTEEEAAKKYAEGDPYVKNGIVTGYSIEEWNVVLQKED